ncbi:MAG: Cupin 2 conserved barrel domain protein [Segetibacter sp.]|nr:Cupin 2 conserved barrel domain protein [Segetibacter sp.]
MNRKKFKLIVAVAFAMLTIVACKQTTVMDTDKNQSIFPKGEKASVEYFTGIAWVKNLVPDDTTFNIIISDVVFEPGARNNWHKHPSGQILIVTNGLGYYQEKGKPIQLLHKGDVVKIAPGIVHWHGAAPDSQFTHIAINPNTEHGVVEWMEKVTDEEYNE